MKYTCSCKEFTCTVICFLHLKALVPNALYSVLFLVDKEAAAKPERDMNVQVIPDRASNFVLNFVADILAFFFLSPDPQTETLTSLKALLKHIDQTQLTRDLDGTFHYDHNHWIHFRRVGVTVAS